MGGLLGCRQIYIKMTESEKIILETTPERLADFLNGNNGFQKMIRFVAGRPVVKVSPLGDIEPGQEFVLEVRLIKDFSSGKERK